MVKYLYYTVLLFTFQKLYKCKTLTKHRMNEMWDLCFYRLKKRASNSKMWDGSETRRIKRERDINIYVLRLNWLMFWEFGKISSFCKTTKIQHFCSCSFPRQSCNGECQQHIEKNVLFQNPCIKLLYFDFPANTTDINYNSELLSVQKLLLVW